MQEGKLKISELQRSMSNLDTFETKLTDHYTGSQKSVADTYAVSLATTSWLLVTLKTLKNLPKLIVKVTRQNKFR